MRSLLILTSALRSYFFRKMCFFWMLCAYFLYFDVCIPIKGLKNEHGVFSFGKISKLVEAWNFCTILYVRLKVQQEGLHRVKSVHWRYSWRSSRRYFWTNSWINKFLCLTELSSACSCSALLETELLSSSSSEELAKMSSSEWTSSRGVTSSSTELLSEAQDVGVRGGRVQSRNTHCAGLLYAHTQLQPFIKNTEMQHIVTHD